MITIKSKPEDILREMEAGYAKAEYWFKKRYGGDKGYEKMRDRMMEQVAFTRKAQSSDTVEYIDRNGNRWRMFEYAQINSRDFVNSNLYVFVYTETYGSCGAYIPQWDMSDFRCENMGCVIYTTHFFQRFCERLGIQYRSSEMIKNFVQIIPFQNFVKLDTYRSGMREVVGNLPGSKAFGVVRYEEGERRVIEMRTYLTDNMLTGKDAEVAKSLNSKNEFDPMTLDEVKMLAHKGAEEGKVDEVVDLVADNMSKLGMDKEDMKVSFNLNAGVIGGLAGIGSISPKRSNEWDKLAKAIAKKSLQAAHRINHPDEFKGVVPFLEVVNLAKYGAEQMGLKFDVNEYAGEVLRSFWKMEPEGDYRKDVEDYPWFT